MTAETNYFWLNCGYNRWNHNEPLVGQTAVFESGAQFNPSQGYRAFKQAKVGDKVIFYQVQTDAGLLGWGEITNVVTGAQNKIHVQFKFKETFKDIIQVFSRQNKMTAFLNWIERTTYVQNQFFTVMKWEVSGTLNYMKPREFVLVSVLEGEGELITDGTIYPIQKGSHFILTAEDLDNVFEGELTLMMSYV